MRRLPAKCAWRRVQVASARTSFAKNRSMKRLFVRHALLLGLVAIGAAPLTAAAQQSDKVFRLGYLSQPTRASVEKGVQAFVRTLNALGWQEGRNLIIEYRWAEGDT